MTPWWKLRAVFDDHRAMIGIVLFLVTLVAAGLLYAFGLDLDEGLYWMALPLVLAVVITGDEW